MEDKADQIIKWEDKFVTGIGKIDHEHKGLVTAINKLWHAFIKRKEYTILLTLLSQFENLMKSHFATEEGYMTEHNYPYYENHKEQHAQILKTFTILKKSFVKNDITEKYMETVKHLAVEWYNIHVVQVDMELGKYLEEVKNIKK